MKCCLCGREIDDEWGNNPWPLCDENDQESKCCDLCNNLYVIPSRLGARIIIPKKERKQ